MAYALTFLKEAEKEWRKLDSSIKRQLQKKLNERLHNPRIPSARLNDMPDCYKIKLRKIGYRLIYRVYDDRIVVQVIALGRRDDGIYITAQKRM